MSAFIVPDSDYVQRALNAINGSNEIVVDVETSGLEKHKNFVCGYVFTVGPRPEDNFYLPVRHKGGGNIPGCRVPENKYDFRPVHDDHPIEAEIRRVARDPRKHWVGHNIKYDMWLMHRHGIYLEGTVEDTQVAAALLNESQGEYNLDACAAAMGVPPKEAEIYQYIADRMAVQGIKLDPAPRKTMGYFWEMPGDGMAAKYALQDGDTTWQLKDAQRVELQAQSLMKCFGVEKRVTKSLFHMERHGVPICEETLDKVDRRIGEMLDAAKKRLPEGFNARSSKQVQAWVEAAGHTDWPTTAIGNPSFPEEWLETFEAGQDVIAVRQYENLRNTFLKGAVRGHLHEGRIHCNFNQTNMGDYGTVSGRLSCNDPNLQQIPKNNIKIAALLRQCFKPRAPFQWYSADYSQQEYRVFAEYAQAKIVLEAYRNNPRTDYHQFVADLLDVVRDPDAKRINLGTIYNMGIPKLALQLDKPIDVARSYMNKMRQLMPEAKGFNQRAEQVAKARGYVRTKLDRRRRFPGGEYAHKAGNAIIQGSSADMTKIKLVEIDEFLRSEKCETTLMLQIHDSLDFEWHPGEQKIMDECYRIMTSFGPNDLIQFEVPIVADTGYGPSWGHATFKNKYTDWV